VTATEVVVVAVVEVGAMLVVAVVTVTAAVAVTEMTTGRVAAVVACSRSVGTAVALVCTT
jgi:hypothetical protein